MTMKSITILFAITIMFNMNGCAQKVKKEEIKSSQNSVMQKTKITKTDAEWKKQLTPEQYNVTREKVALALLRC